MVIPDGSLYCMTYKNPKVLVFLIYFNMFIVVNGLLGLNFQTHLLWSQWWYLFSFKPNSCNYPALTRHTLICHHFKKASTLTDHNCVAKGGKKFKKSEAATYSSFQFRWKGCSIQGITKWDAQLKYNVVMIEV